MAYIIETAMREAFNENHDSIGHGWMDGWMNGWMDGWMDGFNRWMPKRH